MIIPTVVSLSFMYVILLYNLDNTELAQLMNLIGKLGKLGMLTNAHRYMMTCVNVICVEYLLGLSLG